MDDQEPNLDEDLDFATISSTSWSSSSSVNMDDTYTHISYTQPQSKIRYRFDHSMYDCLGRVIIIKVFSDQMNADFTVKMLGKKSSPNIFAVSANQIADNAAMKAQNLFQARAIPESDECFYPPFSYRWIFSFEGCLTTKGASKVLYNKIEEELIL
jgi:hypothetical protein